MLRLADSSEAEYLEQIRVRASLASVTALGHSASEVPSELVELREAASDQRVVVHDVDGIVIGYSMVSAVEGGSAELAGLFVEIAARGQGRGEALCAAAIQVATDRGARVITVVGQPLAVTLYERVGFRSMGTITTLFGDGVLMRYDVATDGN